MGNEQTIYVGKKELRSYLVQELRLFQMEKKMASGEKAELEDWVKRGYSVYSNPWFIADDNGHELDYIDARRILEAVSVDMFGSVLKYCDGSAEF
jgi:hypothetical protein